MFKQRLYGTLVMLIVLPFVFSPAIEQVTAFKNRYASRTAAVAVKLLHQLSPSTVSLLRLRPSTSSASIPVTDDTRMKNGGMTLTAEQVDAILASYGSPAQGTGQTFVDASERTGIDNAWVLAMFIHESTAGTAGVAVQTKSSGNIICTRNPCVGRFNSYATWEEGIEAHFDLLNDYIETTKYGHRHEDIIDVLNTWAPPSDNNNQNLDDPSSYPNAVLNDVRAWRDVSAGQFAAEAQTEQLSDDEATYLLDLAATLPGLGSASEERQMIVELALSRQGDPYVSGGRQAGGSDCSGFVQYVYKTAVGIDPGWTTYDQFPNLRPIEPEELKPGDLWYGAFSGPPPNNEHTGIVADVDGDGRWDLIHNGADMSQVHVTYDFLNTYLGGHTMGFRRALND